MKLLPDTHLLLWAAESIERVPLGARELIANPENELLFSVVSLLLPILSEHAVTIDSLAPIHKDPFDRLLIAQAVVEGITLLTNDAVLAQYQGPVRLA